MAARIAASPVNTALTIADHRRRTHRSAKSTDAELDAAFAPVPESVPRAPSEPPPEPPADMVFTAAMLAGQMPAESMTVLELQARRDTAWQPPASDLHLTNRRI